MLRRPYSATDMIAEALKNRGHDVEFVSEKYFELTNSKTQYDDFDLFYYWLGGGVESRICLLDTLHKNGVAVINRCLSTEPVIRSKIYQTYKVHCAGFKTPMTISRVRVDFNEMATLLGAPFIMKASVGSCGSQVYLIENSEDMKKVLDSAEKRVEFLFQKLIPNSGDYRIHVVGGKAVCGYKRVPNPGDFRANVSRGGSMESIDDGELRSKLFEMAEGIIALFDNADVFGVDLMQDMNTGEINFIELNEFPGIKDVKEVTGVDIADETAKYFESFAKKKN